MNNAGVDPRRLELLLALSRLGSMREVAGVLGVTTSTVSQQIAALAREVGTPLTEPDGRRVRLTPAGRRLAEHAVTILAAVEAARLDLDPAAPPAGTVRVAGYHTAIREVLLPAVQSLSRSCPEVRLVIQEQEPPEALALLEDDRVDLALTYDYNLAPADFGSSVLPRPLSRTAWSLAVPARSRRTPGNAAAVFGAFAEHEWIVNSRNTADEEVVRSIAAMAGFRPKVTHRADTLALVQEMVVAGLGVGLLPASQPRTPGVSLRRLREPEVWLRAYALTRPGRTEWAPLALVSRLVAKASRRRPES
jgi:DNA-binding transcriptional LysR family regulator